MCAFVMLHVCLFDFVSVSGWQISGQQLYVFCPLRTEAFSKKTLSLQKEVKMKSFITCCLLTLIVFCEASSLSQARYALSATSIGDLAIFAGGNDGTAPTNRVDMYKISSNSWSTANLSQPRDSLAATSVGNLAIFAGEDMSTLKIITEAQKLRSRLILCFFLFG